MTVIMKLPTFAMATASPAEVSVARFAEQNSRMATEHGVRESV